MSMSSPGEDGRAVREAPQAGCEDAAAWWPRRRSMWFDVSLSAVAALEGGWDAVKFSLQHGDHAIVVLAAAALLGAATGGSLLVRRRWPLVPVVVALASLPVQVGYMQLVIGLYSIGVYRPAGPGRWGLRRMMTVVSAVVMAEAIALAFWQLESLGEANGGLRHPLPVYLRLIIAVLIGIGLTLPPVVIGLYVGARRRLMESLRERAEGLETELALLAGQAQERARRAQVEERTRIAREMHDVVAHRVSLMVVHASALERVVHKDQERAAESARLLGDIGRQALDELRQILGVLRTVPTPGAEETEESLGLAPRLADVARVVDESRAAGLPVRLTMGGARRALSAEAEQTAYRVIQEALTNVLKHAPGAETEVVVAYVPNGVALAVSNAAPAGLRAAADGRQALPSGGNGLVGMRERVTALGGAFQAGPTDDGGFRVEARLAAARG